MAAADLPDPLIVLVDDTRLFGDGRDCLVARSSSAGVELLQRLRGTRIDQLWLDHDLGGDDDIWPVVRLLEDAHLAGEPFDVGVVQVQASRPGPAHRIGVSMRRLGYRTERPYDLRIWGAADAVRRGSAEHVRSSKDDAASVLTAGRDA